MARITKLPKIKVSRKYHDLQTPALVSFAEGTKFSGTGASTPPVADATINTDANTLLLTHNGRQTSTSKTATNTETTQRNAMLADLDKNANYLENAANDAAIAAADAAAGIGLVNAVGFKVAGKGSGKHHYGIVATGPGWVEAHEEKIVKGTEGHIWEYGTTTNKTTPPTATTTRFSLTAQVIFQGLASEAVFAYREASIVPSVHKKTGGGTTGSIPAPSTAKKATKLPTGKGKHPIIDVTNTSPYTFTDWRYTVVP